MTPHFQLLHRYWMINRWMIKGQRHLAYFIVQCFSFMTEVFWVRINEWLKRKKKEKQTTFILISLCHWHLYPDLYVFNLPYHLPLKPDQMIKPLTLLGISVKFLEAFLQKWMTNCPICRQEDFLSLHCHYDATTVHFNLAFIPMYKSPHFFSFLFD